MATVRFLFVMWLIIIDVSNSGLVEIYIVVRSLGDLLSPAYHAFASALLRANPQPRFRATNGGGVRPCMFVTPRTSPVLQEVFGACETRGRSGAKKQQAALGRRRVFGKEVSNEFNVADAKCDCRTGDHHCLRSGLAA
jgi:hypothetical protein